MTRVPRPVAKLDLPPGPERSGLRRLPGQVRRDRLGGVILEYGPPDEVTQAM
jgi:hypothetical protein